MGNGYQRASGDALGELTASIRNILTRLRELETMRGSQIYDSVKELRSLVENLQETIEDLSSSGATWYGPVSTSGTVQGTAGLNSAGVYSNLLSSSYRAVWVTSSTGDLGYVPSSRRFKQDEAPAPSVTDQLMGVQVVTYRYRKAVEELGDAAAIEWGVIAEDLHALGLTWLVDYDDDGSPFGVRYDRLSLCLLPMLQDHERRLSALEDGSARFLNAIRP